MAMTNKQPALETLHEVSTVTMPPEVLVKCPLVEFDMRPAFKCARCEFMAGITDQYEGSKMPFHRRYVLRCVHPQHPAKRELYRLTDK